MSKLMRNFKVLALAACLGTAAQASVLTFEDLPAGPAFFTSDYQGFRFGNNDPATNPWFYTSEPSAFYTPSSPTHYIATDFRLYDPTNPSQPTQAISSATDFVFNGAFFSGGDSIYYQLYNNGTLLFTSAPSATLTNVPMFVASGYNGLIDSVVIFGRQGFYALDDFTFNENRVPEPGSYALALAGLFAAFVVGRKRSK